MLTVVAKGKIDCLLIPRAESSASLAMVSCAPMSRVPFLDLACLAMGFVIRSGNANPNSLHTALSKSINISTVGENLGGRLVQA